MYRTILAVFTLSLIASSSLAAKDALTQKWLDEFKFRTFVGGSKERFEVYWTPKEDDCIIEIGLKVQTDGWVAFGVSLSGAGMNNADIVFGWVTADGEAVLQNRIGAGKQLPLLFADQSHATLVSGSKQDIDGKKWTFIRFTKELFPEHDKSVPVKVGTTQTIWAWRNGELAKDATPLYHGRCDGPDGCRGIEAMNLLQGESLPVPVPSDTKTYDIFYPNVTVPSADTTYYCYVQELPEIETENHIIRLDPLIEEENSGVVHHIVIYSCPESILNKSHVGMGSDCENLHANMPGTQCRNGQLIYAWAIGGKSYHFPEHVGLPMGGPGNDKLKYVMVETHYDNPTMRSDIVDSSGVTIHYTPTKRQYDAGLLTFGSIPGYIGQFMPSGLSDIVNYGYCFADCLRDGMGEVPKIHAFANLLHTHIYGRQIYLRHIRNGKELPPLDVNEAYDFDYQQTVAFPKEVEILPGDQFVTECRYDTTGKTTPGVVVGGESTNEEMCFTFLYVYPAIKLAQCTSYYQPTNFQRFQQRAVQRGYYNPQTMHYNTSLPGATEFYRAFAQGHHNSSGGVRQQYCTNPENKPLGAAHDTVSATIRPHTNFEPYVKPNLCSKKTTTSPPTLITTSTTLSGGNLGANNGGKDTPDAFPWWGYLLITLIIILVVAFAAYVYMTKKGSRGQADTSYSGVAHSERTVIAMTNSPETAA